MAYDCQIPSMHTTVIYKSLLSYMYTVLYWNLYPIIYTPHIIDNPLRDLCTYDLSVYMSCGHTVPGTITHRILQLGLSPIDCAFNKYRPCHTMCHDGVVDSLRQLIYHENYAKPWSDEYVLSVLLTKAF